MHTRSCGWPRRRPARARLFSRRPSSACRQPPSGRLHWRSDFSSLPLSAIARKLSAQGEPRLRGVRIPAGTEALSLRARLRGPDVLARIVVADRRGRISLLPLGRVGRQEITLTARVPRERGLRVLGIQLALPESEAFMLAHDEAEGSVATARSGEIAIGPLYAGGRVLTDWRDWTLSTGGDVLPRAGGSTIRYAFPDIGAHLVFRPTQPTDGQVMPVRRLARHRPRRGRGRCDHRARLPGHARRRPDRRSGVAAAVRSGRQRRVRPHRRRLAVDGDRRERARRGDAERDLDLGAGRRLGRRSDAAPAAVCRARRGLACSDRATPRRRPARPRDRNRAGRSRAGRARGGRTRLLGRRGQRTARREERLLRPRGPGASARGHAPTAAHARGDPARGRLRRRPGAGRAALPPRRLADPGVGHDRGAGTAAAARSRLAGRRARHRCADAGRAARRRGGLARRLPRQRGPNARPGASNERRSRAETRQRS